MAFHAKVNKEIEDLEAGDIAVDIMRTKGGRWSYENRNLKLKIGDVINYWVHVQYNGLGYDRLGLTWTVSRKFNKLLSLFHSYNLSLDKRPSRLISKNAFIGLFHIICIILILSVALNFTNI